MIVIISPAKTLDLGDWDELAEKAERGRPEFQQSAEKIVSKLQSLTLDELKKVLSVNESLASLNEHRMKEWPEADEKPCALSYDGPAYRSLKAAEFSKKEFVYAQEHLRIISGLYGLLKPGDLIKPYRLEMANKLEIDGCKNLYAFWKETLTEELNRALQSLPEKQRYLVNCASQEYSKAIDFKKITCPVLEIKFPGPSVYAKAARGAMARYIIKEKVNSPKDLQAFTGEAEEWSFCEAKSSESELVFERNAKQASKKIDKPEAADLQKKDKRKKEESDKQDSASQPKKKSKKKA